MKLFEKLRGKRSVEDLEAALQENLSDAGALRRRMTDIAERREETLIEQGETALAKLDAETTEIQHKIGVLALAEGAIRKRIDAAAAERAAAAEEALADNAKDLCEELEARLCSYHKHAVALADDAIQVIALDQKIREVNEHLSRIGRADLAVALPWLGIQQRLVISAKEEGFSFPRSEKWQDVARRNGIAAVPESEWTGVPLGPSISDFSKINIPHYLENGAVRWMQPYRFV